MGRPKGSKNKSTRAKEAAAKAFALDVDKFGNLTRGGQKVGVVTFEDGVFTAVLPNTGLFWNGDFDTLLDSIQQTVVF